MSGTHSEGTARVPDGGLRMRTKPDATFDAIASLPGGAEVEVLRRDGGWALVSGPDGSVGWVDGRRLEQVATSPPVPERRDVSRSTAGEGDHESEDDADASPAPNGGIGRRLAMVPLSVLAVVMVLGATALPWLPTDEALVPRGRAEFLPEFLSEIIDMEIATFLIVVAVSFASLIGLGASRIVRASVGFGVLVVLALTYLSDWGDLSEVGLTSLWRHRGFWLAVLAALVYVAEAMLRRGPADDGGATPVDGAA